VVFDEFHERSLDADLGLALARDVQLGLREDLKLWSCRQRSTARASAAARRCAGDRSAGRAFPVETRYLGRDSQQPVERQVADALCARCGPMQDRCWSFFRALPRSGVPKFPCVSE
jgi:ATP-dependent helicase HrpB